MIMAYPKAGDPLVKAGEPTIRAFRFQHRQAWMPGRSLCPGLARMPGMTEWQRPPLSDRLRIGSLAVSVLRLRHRRRVRRRHIAFPDSGQSQPLRIMQPIGLALHGSRVEKALDG